MRKLHYSYLPDLNSERQLTPSISVEGMSSSPWYAPRSLALDGQGMTRSGHILFKGRRRKENLFQYYPLPQFKMSVPTAAKTDEVETDEAETDTRIEYGGRSPSLVPITI
jgi:hypothetical protein